MNREAVEAAVAELATMVQADGADLTLESVDPARDRVEVQLHVADATCAECVLPTPLLHQVITDAIGRRVPTDFELVLHDPRTAGS